MLKWYETIENGLFTGSRAMSPPWGPVLRVARYPAALLRDWLRGEITVRAMSLAYTTLLSIVPLLVFSFAILKSLGARGDLHFILSQFFAPMGAAADQLTESVMQFVAICAAICWARSACCSWFIPSSRPFKRSKPASISCGGWTGRARFLRRFTEYLTVMIIGAGPARRWRWACWRAPNTAPFALWVDGIAPLGVDH